MTTKCDRCEKDANRYRGILADGRIRGFPFAHIHCGCCDLGPLCNACVRSDGYDDSLPYCPECWKEHRPTGRETPRAGDGPGEWR